MQRIFVAIVATVLIAGLTPASAASARGGGTRGNGGVHIRSPRVEPPPQAASPQSRVPAPLPQPTQPPVVNGPVGPSGLPTMGNGLR